MAQSLHEKIHTASTLLVLEIIKNEKNQIQVWNLQKRLFDRILKEGGDILKAADYAHGQYSRIMWY